MNNIKVYFSLLIICLLLSNCSIFDTDSEKFLKGKHIGGFRLLVDIGSCAYPTSFFLTKDGWCFYSFHREMTPESAPDTIFFNDPNNKTKYLITSWSVRRTKNIRHIALMNGQPYLIGDVFFNDLKSEVYKYDVSSTQAVLIYSDSTLGLKYQGSDSVNFHYYAKSGGKYRLNVESRTLAVNTSPFKGFDDTLCYYQGYLISNDSYSISKIDTSTKECLWKTSFPLDSYIKNVIIVDGYIYSCGYEGSSGHIYSGLPGNFRATVAKIDMNGNFSWYNTYGNNGESVIDNFQKIAVDSAGQLLCIGETGAWNGTSYCYLVCIDKSGNQKNEAIVSDVSGKESRMHGLDISEVKKIESGVVHFTFIGSTDPSDPRYYYAQILY